jgi:hypothetical protein
MAALTSKGDILLGSHSKSSGKPTEYEKVKRDTTITRRCCIAVRPGHCGCVFGECVRLKTAEALGASPLVPLLP